MKVDCFISNGHWYNDRNYKDQEKGKDKNGQYEKNIQMISELKAHHLILFDFKFFVFLFCFPFS